jgi:hypothetical protein
MRMGDACNRLRSNRTAFFRIRDTRMVRAPLMDQGVFRLHGGHFRFDAYATVKASY